MNTSLRVKRLWLVLFALVSFTLWMAWPAPYALAQVMPGPDFSSLVEQVSPSVVNIRTTARVTTPQFNFFNDERGGGAGDPFYEFFRRFFPEGQVPPQFRGGPGAPHGQHGEPPMHRKVPRGLGSGFVVSAEGLILTNAHVVQGADEIAVTFPDGREFKAKLIGADKRTDVALLKVDVGNLSPLKLGDPDKTKVGQWVIAIGSPFGLDSTVTAGIVSAKNRETNELLPFIQTDVAVNPGNSGGPLINMRGEVIGINSQIFTTSGGYNGISLAIPIDEAMRVAEQLKDSGRVTRGRIGVRIDEVSKEVAEAIGLGKPQGALVVTVEEDTPAQRAGVQAGDVIVQFGDKQIEHVRDLPRTVFGIKPGTKTQMMVWRKGKRQTLAITVGELKESVQAQGGQAAPSEPVKADVLGLSVSDVSAQELKTLKVAGAVRISAVGDVAAMAGLRPGDLIVSINNSDVTSAKQFERLVDKLNLSKPVALLIQRGDQRSFVILKPNQ